jgi:phosphoglycerol transferase MdoB-like AlkP superfamily enzyme
MNLIIGQQYKKKIIFETFKFIFKNVVLTFSWLVLLRFVFLLIFRGDYQGENASELLKAFYMGTKFDLRFALVFCAPLVLVTSLPFISPVKYNWSKKLYQLIFPLALCAILMVALLDLYFFEYQKVRLNSTILELLVNTKTSLEMAWQTYPIISLSLLSLVFFIVNFFIVRAFIKESDYYHGSISFKVKFFNVLFFILLYALGIYGKFAFYPLRWSEAFFSSNSFVSNFALNPHLHFYNTYKFKAKDFSLDKLKGYYPRVAEFMGLESQYSSVPSFSRKVESPLQFEKRPNVVVIVMESMAAFKTGSFGSGVNPTPYLDAVAKDSVLFKRFYTASIATARSMFATVTSLPDVSRVKTGSRNPLIVDQNVLLNYMTDYKKFYFLGGSANWGNIRGVLSHNITDLKIFEEGSYKAPRVDVWGISDLDLFREAHDVLNNANQIGLEKPFFALIQSSSFHRPHTIPEDRGDFKTFKVDPAQLKNYGFTDQKEYDSLRFQDYSLGEFFKLAKKSDYYENTIFLIYGDHGIPHNFSVNVPQWQREIQLHGYHVPLVVHGPKFFEPSVNESIVSQLDIMPTVVSLAGYDYEIKSWGRNIFDEDESKDRFAFSYNVYHPYYINLVGKEFYFEKIPGSAKGLLRRYRSVNPRANVAAEFPEAYKKMNDLTEGLYETAKYLLYNNKKIK